MKYMTAKELRDSGLLQEVNRQFFHPRGLALAVIFSDGALIDEREVVHAYIQDVRDDPEGMIFGFTSLYSAEQLEEARARRASSDALLDALRPGRAGLGLVDEHSVEVLP